MKINLFSHLSLYRVLVEDVDGEVAGEDDKVADKDCDQVYGYACEVLSLALIWHSYHDAV